ncbi:MAG: MBL fold metallo-hydrolase [Clostridiales bacterium]|nr:MBL fold metallo-hydrolase [Clostridiales bacterium]
MRLCSIASGSSGNCIYVGSNNTHILIDVGVSAKRIEASLDEIKVDPSTIAGILITHEHSDHIQGIGVMARRYNIPIYGTVETINAIIKQKSVGRIDENLFHYVKPDEVFLLGDVTVEPYSISHDASNPVCYTFIHDGVKIGMATDLGTYNEYTVSKLKDSKILYMEANHDVNMLMVGGYPYYLKQRILGDHGHLSNERSASLICELLNDRLEHIILGHLSKENNYAELAYETVRFEVTQKWPDSSTMPKIVVANRDIVSDMVVINEEKTY